MDKTSEQSVPVPKPRRQIIINEPNTKLAYENVSIDLINKNIDINDDNLQANRKSKVQNNKTFILPAGVNEDYRNLITEMNNLNTDKNKNIANKNIPEASKINNLNETIAKPVPAPRRACSQITEDIYENNSAVPPPSPVVAVAHTSGAVSKIHNVTRTAPQAPKVLDSPVSPERRKNKTFVGEADKFEFPKRDLQKSRSNTSLNSSNSGCSSSEQSSKYNTTSPGALLKSISATSKLLTESITERVTVKTKDARHKIDKIQKSSREKLSETTKSATNTLKNVRKNITKIGDNFSLGRNEKKMPDFDPDRPQTVPPNDEIFQSISFYSPLKSKTNNCENLSTAESSYEIPRKSRSCSTDFSGDKTLSYPCPSYDEVRKQNLSYTDSDSSMSLNSSDKLFTRNTTVTQSMCSNVGNTPSPLPAIRTKIKSETNLNEPTSIAKRDPIPCPNYPPPVHKENVYGRLNISAHSSSTESDSPVLPPVRQKRRKDYETTEIRVKPSKLVNHSNRATVDSNEFNTVSVEDRFPKIFSRDISSDYTDKIELEEKNIPQAARSDSWAFYDTNNDDDGGNSSPEPIYANEGKTIYQEPVYGLLYNMDSPEGTLLTPQAVARKKRSNTITTTANSSSTDILKEFDPLVVSTVDEIFSNKSNELILLENLLGEETYGPLNEDNNFDNNSSEMSDDEYSTEENIPLPPIRQDSLQDDTLNIPSTSKSQSNDNRKTIIIHQNMNLRSDSMENILDEEAAVAPYLAQNDEEPLRVSPVDLSRPVPSKSNWFIDSSNVTNDKFSKNPSINPINNRIDEKPADKVVKNVIKRPKEDKPVFDPPSYSEAIGESATDDKPTPKTSMKTMFSNVLNKMEGINLNIKRKQSFKYTSKSDVNIIIEMIPKPYLTQRLVLYEGHLIKLPSGVVDDILKEQHSRKAFIREKKFQAYFDKDLKIAKENFALEHITTIQCVSNHKFTNNSTEIHCFEITITLPKHQSNMSNPNMVMSTTNSGNKKTLRICHLFGTIKESERYIWMQKLLDSMTDVFPAGYTCKYYRAGWCYLKNSITSQWSSAWILLQKQKRKLLFYSCSDMNLECLDLRKARCLVLKDSDDSIKNLHVENGPMLMIDCPPFSMYMIMSSPRETKIWRHIIKEVAHNNGSSLKDQQLTKDDVPVLVDKCINFIYAHGSMSEGIYRKSGSENSIQKLLTLFRTDAFNVQITRTEYTENDVANALKRFMRDLPDRLLGKYSISFISITEMKSKSEKIAAYKELLHRLPTIEYHTLKKLIGHLNFIQSQKIRNKMGVDNLAILWGPTLLQDKHSEMQYSQKEGDVIIDLITFYKTLYQLTPDEVSKEKIMLSVLKKYHAAAENLSDAVKQSGDLKVWITIDPDPDNDKEEKQQINVTLTPTKTVYDVCKELAPRMKKQPFTLTLSEIILNGELQRPLHYSEKVFDIVLNWSYWPESDRKNNFLQLRPMKFLKEVERALKNLPSVSPNKELKFADSRTKAFKSYTLELCDGHITVMKKEKNTIVKVKAIDLKKATAYIGCEKKRDFQSRWAITLIETDSNKNILRSRESPFIGHVIAGTNSNDSTVWYSSILHSLYGDDIMPSPEIIIP